jgi:glycerol-3-phosphate dehydrogenase
MSVSYAVVGGGVVGCAVGLGLARRGCDVVLFEAQADLALSASGTNSGILHTGFDSEPGELETAMILRAVPLRDEAITSLEIPVMACGARMRGAPAEVEEKARLNGVSVRRDGEDLLIPGESVTDPVAMTRAFAAEAQRLGMTVELGRKVTSDLPEFDVVINCAGLYADQVARAFGDESFGIRPRKGEFLVYENPGLTEILLPVPTPETKGILVFPTLDGHVCCGPTAENVDDKEDWSVRVQAQRVLHEHASRMLPGLADEPIFAYAGLRPAGVSGENYVIGWSSASERLLNVAAVRSTGLTAALGIADHVCVDLLRIEREPARYGSPSSPVPAGSWWRRTAESRGLA